MPKTTPSGDPHFARRFRRALLHWYDRSHRKLPWRGELNPYRILVSEIMLQQTRVAVVEHRYAEFLRRFPTIQKLARAREQTVLAAWSGLGYYRRARSLRQAAITILRQQSFPRTASELEMLPGVGRYTAAAVASIAFGESAAVVDGNVQRVLSRVTGRQLSQSQSWSFAGELLERKRPGDFNQAMMELGAMVCLPNGDPKCFDCPIFPLCCWRGPKPKPAADSRRRAELRYLVVRRKDAILLRRRPASSSLMPLMWELPEPMEPLKLEPLLKLRHSITNTNYTVLVFAGKDSGLKGAKWAPLRTADKLPLTGLARKILREVRQRPPSIVFTHSSAK